MTGTRRARLTLIMLTVLVGCDEPPEPKGLGPVEEMPAFVALSSDYSTTSVSLLGRTGEPIADDYFNSGSAKTGLVSALSGDVALPTRSGDDATLVLLDRFRTDVITRIAMPSGELLGQVKTHTPPEHDSESAYSSNPHDYVQIDASSAWVSRYEPNLDPAVPAIDRGTDLLRIDPSTMERTGDRIDLSVLNTTGTRTDPDTGKDEVVDIYARPSRMVHVENLLIVGLSRASFDFSAVGPGAVALVDLSSRKVSSFELDGLTSCGEVAPVLARPNAVLVSCRGFWGGNPRDTAGLVMLDVSDGKAEILHAFRGADHPDKPLAISSPVSLGGTLVGAVARGTMAQDAMGDLPATEFVPDQFVIVDLASGEQQQVLETESIYVLGTGSFDPETGLLLVPDASVDADMRPTAGLRRLRRNPSGAFTELPTVQLGVKLAMPVREVRPL